VTLAAIGLLALGFAQYARGLELVERGELAEALAAFEAETDPARRAEGRAWTYYRARDPGRSLEEAQRGLALAPDDPALLHRAASAALYLGDARAARAQLDALAASIADLPEDERRRFFAGEVERLGALAREAEVHRAAIATAVRRARTVTAGVLVAAFAALAWLGLREVEEPGGELQVEEER